jgi:hypothetical protein
MHLALAFFAANAWIFLSLLIDELTDWAEHHENNAPFDSTKMLALTFATAMNLSGCLLMLFQILNNPTQH